MPPLPSNIILIGMPGAGKSTVGVILAKQLALDFVDTDLLIQLDQQARLQEIVDERGYLELRRIEARILKSIEYEDHVIATGGSAIYSDEAMRHLKTLGTIVYLQISLPGLQERVLDEAQRGIAKPAGQTFADVYRERTPLYEQHADVTIACDGLIPEQIVAEIAAELRQ